MFATLLAVLLMYCSRSAAQGCSSLPDSTQVPGLIASNYQGIGQGTPPTITLQTSPLGYSYRIVCTSSSGVRNQYRFVSIVAYYTSSTLGGPMYGQFEFECVNSVWSAISTLLDNTLFDRVTLTVSISPAVNVSVMRTDCAYCLSSTALSPPRQSDSVSHCSPCSGCSQPALCYTTDTSAPSTGYFSQTCCNYFLQNGACTTECLPPSFPDANRTCIPCPLNCQNGGTLRSDMCGCNCTAVRSGENCTTCRCQNGGTCSGTMCNCPPGYSGQLCGTCSRSCLPGSYLNSSTCSCVMLPGNTPVSTGAATGCDPGCIGAIIGAILGAILVAAIVTAVIVGVYYVIRTPSTATKGFPLQGPSGKTKENPLYLDPKTVEDSIPD